jgi:hypothetical protein
MRSKTVKFWRLFVYQIITIWWLICYNPERTLHAAGRKSSDIFAKFTPGFSSKENKSFFKIKPTRCTKFTEFILSGYSTCFGQFVCPSSGVYSLYTQQWYTSCRFLDAFLTGAYATAQNLSTNLHDIHHCWVYSE